jgi:hypothetical protein
MSLTIAGAMRQPARLGTGYPVPPSRQASSPCSMSRCLASAGKSGQASIRARICCQLAISAHWGTHRRSELPFSPCFSDSFESRRVYFCNPLPRSEFFRCRKLRCSGHRNAERPADDGQRTCSAGSVGGRPRPGGASTINWMKLVPRGGSPCNLCRTFVIKIL